MYIYIYIYIYKYVYWYDSFVILLMYVAFCYIGCIEVCIDNVVYLVIYSLVKQWEQCQNHASLFLFLLLLLIVIYNDAGMYNKTIIIDWYVADDDIG